MAIKTERFLKAGCYNFVDGLGMLIGRAESSLFAMPRPDNHTRRLIPETQISFSPELARAVGVDGAILIQQIKSVYQHQPATLREGLDWLHISHAYLLELMPFWSIEKLLDICDQMESLGLLRIDREQAASGCILLAIDDPQATVTPVAASPEDAWKPPREAVRPAAPESAAKKSSLRALKSDRGGPLPRGFQPSVDMLELLERLHQIPRSFSLAQLEDFILYWTERGVARHSWDLHFKQHVESQWEWHLKKLSDDKKSRGGPHERGHAAGGATATRARSIEHDLTDTSWAE